MSLMKIVSLGRYFKWYPPLLLDGIGFKSDIRKPVTLWNWIFQKALQNIYIYLEVHVQDCNKYFIMGVPDSQQFSQLRLAIGGQ